MRLSCTFKVLLCVNVALVVGKPSRYGAGGRSLYMVPVYTAVRQHVINQRARNQAVNSGSSNNLGNSGNWANPNVENVVHGIPMSRAPASHDKPGEEEENNSESLETSYQEQEDLVYDDNSDNGNGYSSFKYGDDGMAMVY